MSAKMLPSHNKTFDHICTMDEYSSRHYPINFPLVPLKYVNTSDTPEQLEDRIYFLRYI